MMLNSFEVGPYRPPSEAYSLLLRVTRNCPWNRCKFCSMYKGKKFEYRAVEEIKKDIEAVRMIQDKIKEISWKSGVGTEGLKEVAGKMLNSSSDGAFRHVALWLYAGGETVFLQDSNSIIMRNNELVEVISFLKETLPSINRITSYGRSDTAAKKKPEELAGLYQAGLSRVHIGLETGYDRLLGYMDKGVTAAKHIAGGRKVVESGISLCEYVVLGLGGREMWREHAIQTARVLNEINPDFIRVRTLTVKDGMLLHGEVENGSFIRSTDEQIIEEEKLLIEHLDCSSNYVSDHITNLLQQIEGRLPDDKEKMLDMIDNFQALSLEERVNFRVGRRVGIYTQLDDLCDGYKHEAVEQFIHKLSQGSNHLDEKTIYTLMERFI
jgi:biotin synthase-like enzyme